MPPATASEGEAVNTVIVESNNNGEPQPESTLPRKRRSAAGRMAYPRKRALTACQVCRMRKNKCDNRRPSCGTCLSLGATCSYQDQSTDFSSFDNASLAILNRVNYAIQLLETRQVGEDNESLRRQAYGQSSADQIVFRFHEEGPEGVLPSPSGGDLESPRNLLQDVDATLTDALNMSSKCSNSSILEWPILDKPALRDAIVSSFFGSVEEPSSDQHERLMRTFSSSSRADRDGKFSRGVNEEDTIPFIEDFLRNVHTKNPILEPADLFAMGRTVVEEGFKWDGLSCLVLIACALGCISRPFTVINSTEENSSIPDARNYFQAETYYTAARKRLGLLESSALATQCYFLTGVYEMYTLRPLAAWLSFNRACTVFQIYLHIRSLNIGQPARRLEQRLYWSCLKSECEMREEIELPPTGLAKIEYPDLFPSPPAASPEPESGQLSTRVTWEPILHQSWYYYLSEIACRRIANRVITSLYSMEPAEWLNVPLPRLNRIAEELDAQLLQWWQHLPGSPSTIMDSDVDELTYMLHARYIDLRERVWRPFLYLATCTTPAQAHRDLVNTNAVKCLDLVFDIIGRSSIRHRHHGSWYGVRSQFTRALLIVAAVKSDRVFIRDDWLQHINAVQATLQYWEAEAPDATVMRRGLTELVAEIVQC